MTRISQSSNLPLSCLKLYYGLGDLCRNKDEYRFSNLVRFALVQNAKEVKGFDPKFFAVHLGPLAKSAICKPGPDVDIHFQQKLRTQLLLSLDTIGGREARKVLFNYLTDPDIDPNVRADVFFALGDIGGSASLNLLKGVLKRLTKADDELLEYLCTAIKKLEATQL